MFVSFRRVILTLGSAALCLCSREFYLINSTLTKCLIHREIIRMNESASNLKSQNGFFVFVFVLFFFLDFLCTDNMFVWNYYYVMKVSCLMLYILHWYKVFLYISIQTQWWGQNDHRKWKGKLYSSMITSDRRERLHRSPRCLLFFFSCIAQIA